MKKSVLKDFLQAMQNIAIAIAVSAFRKNCHCVWCWYIFHILHILLGVCKKLTYQYDKKPYDLVGVPPLVRV